MENSKFCICRWLLPLIVIIFTFWGTSWGKWIVLIAALIMFWFGVGGKCYCKHSEAKPKKSKK